MPHVKPKDKVPLYSADNELLDWIGPKRAARLESLGLARLVRHKKGHVNRCLLHRRPSDPRPVQPGDYLGTRYSFREHLDSGPMLWTLRKLGKKGQVRSVFMQVVIDCARSV